MYCLTNLMRSDSTNDSGVKIINYDNETSIEALKNVVNLLSYNKNGYDKIYISFGSKMNETFIKFDSPGKKRNKKFLSNSTEQMIPTFVKTCNSDTQILCVVIDNFENEHNINKNIVLLEPEKKPNIDIVIFDKFCSQPFLPELIKYFVKLFILFDMNQKNVMICNYINYNDKTNNEIDSYSQKMIPETIQKVLDSKEFEKYAYCFHQWFGYKFYFYNFIYNYKIFQLIMTVNDNYLNDLETLVKELICDDVNYDNTNDNTKNQKMLLTEPKMLLIMENIYDITSECYYTYEISTSFRKYLYEHGKIELLCQ